MIRALRVRLTATFSILTILVLSAAVIVLFFIAKEQYLLGAQEAFNITFSEISEKLRTGEMISDSLLSSREVSSNGIIYIEDNGTPLNHGNLDARRLNLAKQAKAACYENGLDLNYAHSREAIKSFYFKSEQESYDCRAIYIPKGTLNQKHVIFLYTQAKSVQSGKVGSLALQFSALWALGAASLCALSFILCGFALRPTEKAIKRQIEFTAAASHELRAPLAAIIANLSASTNKKTPPEKAAEFIAQAQSEAQRLCILTNDLLTLSSADESKLSVNLTEVYPDTICIELYEKYHLLSRAKEHELSVSLPENRVNVILSDKERLEQLLSVLLSNAIEHTPSKTNIEIELTQDERETRLSIIDHGNGIPSEEKEQIFERFYRADKSRTDKSHFGLGLSVARGLTKALGAKLLINDTDGGGATFVVIINQSI